MRFDVQNQVCSAQAFTGAATVSEDSYDLQVAGTDISIGRLMAMLLLPTVAAGTGSTHTMEVIQADNAALTTNVESLASVSIAAASLTLGSEHVIPIPQGVITRRYLGVRNTSTGGTTTITMDAYLVPQDEIAKFKSFTKVVDAEV